MLFNLNKGNSSIERDKCGSPVFRPPKFVISPVPSKKTLTATAQPWYPSAQINKKDTDNSRPPPTSPPALGLSPDIKPKPILYPASDQSPLSLDRKSIPFSPLSTPVNRFFHIFSDDATDRRVYPVSMFLSARKDASHTPHGVLQWCMRQYLEVSALKVPAHLQLSMNEVISPEDGVTRGALGSHLKSRPILVRQTRHKVMSILSRITPQKYDNLVDELLKLPLRQTDDAELHEIVKVFFDKAVQEPEYNGLYAQLLQTLCTMREDERKLEVEMWDRLLCHRMRRFLVAACEEEFRRPVRLTPDEQVDRTTGKPLSSEALEMKSTRMKNRLVGNIKFVGELFKMSLITESIITDILRLLVWDYNMANPEAKEDYVFEVFAMLIKTVAPLIRESNPQALSNYLRIAKNVELSHPRPRVRFLMMDLSDLNNKNGWVSSSEIRAANNHIEHMHSPKSLAETVRSSVASTGVTTPTEKNFNHKDSSVEVAPASITPSVSANDMTPRALNINFIFRDSTVATGSTLTSGRTVNNCSPTNTNPTNLFKTHISGTRHFLHDLQMPDAQDPHINASIQRDRAQNSPVTLNPKMRKRSKLPLTIKADEFSSGSLSEGAPTPIFQSTQSLYKRVNIHEIVQQLIEMFNNPEDEDNVLLYLSKIKFRNKVLCLTCWLRGVSINTSLYQERERVTELLSKILLSLPSFKPKDVFMVIVEWMRFDIEKSFFTDCPRVFANIAHIILYSYSKKASEVSNIHDVHELLHAGLFNIMLHELILHRGTDQMLTLAKCAYPVCMSILGRTIDPHEPGDILRVALKNRFRMLQYFIGASNGSESDALSLSWCHCRISSINSKCTTPNGCEDIASPTSHYDPLTQCLSFHQFSEDPEIVLFRSLVSEQSTQRRQEAIRLALSAPKGPSMVSQLNLFMKVIGVSLACPSISAHQNNADLSSRGEEEIAYIFSFRKGTLFQAAAVMELVMHFAQASPFHMGVECETKRIKLLRQVFKRWCIKNLVDKKAVGEIICSLDKTSDGIKVFKSYYNSITDKGFSWDGLLGNLL